MTLPSLKTQFQSAWFKLTTGAKYVFQHCKLYIILALTAVGFIIYRTLLVDILVKSAKDFANKSNKRDQVLASAETKLNQEANQTIADANKLGQNTAPVKADWNLKE